MMVKMAILLGFPYPRRLHGLHMDRISVQNWRSLKRVEQRRKERSPVLEKERVCMSFIIVQSKFCMELF
jgi:hypothetical protein